MSSFLSAEQLAAIRTLKAGDHNLTLTVWRIPAIASGKRGTIAQVSSVTGRLWPASQAPRIVQSLPELSQVRYDAVVFVSDASTILKGDEVRSGSERYTVNGTGIWRTTLVLAVARILT